MAVSYKKMFKLMITGTIKNKIDKIWKDIWASGLTQPITVIEQITYLEPEDYETFEHIEDEIKEGAMIYFAIDDDGTALATCMAKPMEGSTWEL